MEELLAEFEAHSPTLAAQARRRIPLAELGWVLQALIDERAPLVRVGDIVKALMKRPPSPLAAARLALGPDLVRPYLDDEETLHVIGVSRLVEA